MPVEDGENTMSETVSRQFARFIADVTPASLPPAIVTQAKGRILDSLSTAIAAKGLPVPTAAASVIGNNVGNATVIGQRGMVPAADAAFVNATLINGRTQDDFLYKSHPGAVTLSSALALAEEDDRCGADLIAAVAVGYELTSRAYLGGPSMLPGFRATGVAGAIGAAAASAKIMGLGIEETVNTLGLAAMFASGFGAGFLTGTMDVKLNVGMAARNGVTASILARAGATASDRAFEGEAGYYNALSGTTANAGAAIADLGNRFLIEDTIYKEYPVCIFVQTPVALAKALIVRERLTPQQIRSVQVTVSEATYTNPGFRNVAPFENQLKARVSARFCIAAALTGKPIDDFAFYENVEDAEVMAMAERIELVMDEARDDQVSIAIETTGGGTVSIDGSEGETLHPTEPKIVAKFRRIAGPVLGSGTDEVLHDILNLEKLPHVRSLTARLRG
jgi:2-methylcitrate dehydratase PrpD